MVDLWYFYKEIKHSSSFYADLVLPTINYLLSVAKLEEGKVSEKLVYDVAGGP